MFRHIQRATRATRVISTTTKSGIVHPTRILGLYQSHTATKVQIVPTPRLGPPYARPYTTSANDDDSTNPSSEQPENPQDIPWIDFLESPAKAPWLPSTPPAFEDRLRRAYSLLFHIILYLGRPLSNDIKEAEEATQQFLLAFNSAPVSTESEIGRARHAIAVLTKTITNDIISVPQSADLRSKHSQIFALADALVPLCDVHLQEVEQNTTPPTGDVIDSGDKWQDFWTKAQPIILTLGEALDKDGYGISEELAREAKAEQERKEKEQTSENKK